jgi:diketogulonate reductase-like aldo/keto reductase
MSVVVANGARIPSLGYGTYGMQRGDMLRMIPHVLRAGFRHVDTAQTSCCCTGPARPYRWQIRSVL